MNYIYLRENRSRRVLFLNDVQIGKEEDKRSEGDQSESVENRNSSLEKPNL